MQGQDESLHGVSEREREHVHTLQASKQGLLGLQNGQVCVFKSSQDLVDHHLEDLWNATIGKTLALRTSINNHPPRNGKLKKEHQLLVQKHDSKGGYFYDVRLHINLRNE